MALSRWIACVLLALFLWPAAVLGQSPELKFTHNRMIELYGQGRYQEAIHFAEEALILSKREYGPEHPNFALVLNDLGVIYVDQGRYAEAEPLHQRSQAIWEKSLGAEHPNVATSLNNLADFYRDLELYAEAEPLYQRSLAIREKVLGPDHPDVATSLENNAALLRETGRTAEAAKMEDVRSFITKEVQSEITGKPRFSVTGYPRPDVLQNRYNALVMTLQGILNAEICYGDKIYLRATDARNRDMTKGMEGRLKVSENKKTGKLLYPTTVGKQRDGGLYHLQDVMKGSFGEVPTKGIK